MPEFVIVEKDGERLTVHPTTVEAHKAAGWKPVKTVQVEEKPAAKGKTDKQPGETEPPKE